MFRGMLLSDPNNYRCNSWMQQLPKQREKMMRFNQKYWVNWLGKNG